MDDLADQLVRHRSRLKAYVQKHAGPALLRFESVDDLVQGVHAEALGASNRFDWRGEESFLAWLFQVARRYLAGRRDHWFALKRHCGAVLRLTGGGTEGPPLDPRDPRTGPVTFAYRRDQLRRATRALALLRDRDRAIIRWTADGVDLSEQAARLGVTTGAYAVAKGRAVERLRKAFRLVTEREEKL